MKAVGAIATALLGTAVSLTAGVDMTPVSRVVELLKGIEKQTEEEHKSEEALYKKFVCWATTVIDSKTATNAAAKERITSLETYISDIEAGRIEFTSERVDLEKALEEINSAIEAATAMREKEHEEFLGAEDEMVKATTALDKAIIVLKEATEGHEEGVFLEQRSASGEGFAARAGEAKDLEHAVELGEKVLTKGDAIFLRRLLSGEVPERADWKTLNRKATFKMGYKARSGKIQEVLAKLNQTVSINLEDARAKEEKAKTDFDALMEAKNAEKEKTEESLSDMEAENGARGMNKEQAQDEVDSLKTQVENDEKFISQTEASLAEKKDEWKSRQKLRAGEQAAIAKAISILHSDDARDNFKKSFTSQGYSLVQVSQKKASSRSVAERVAALIRESQKAAKSSRLSAIAYLVEASGSHFDKVIEAIDKMVAVLKEEEDSDLHIKEMCESDRARNTREAALISRSMDELTDGITQLEAEIEQIKAEIKEKEAAVKATEEELAKATEIRETEHTEWEGTNRDDEEAKETVIKAKDVLTSFYADNNLMLVQKQKRQPTVVAGEAPPPPPTTWDAPYGGKTDESTSIIAILEMIVEDITKDTADAKASEDKAQAEYDKFKEESEAQIAALQEDITDLTATQGQKEGEVTTKTEERTSAHNELEAVMKTMTDAKPGCDFFAINYPTRLNNRQIELDGLDKAKAILTGASFNEAPDPNREIKPGDAFLVRRHKH